MNWSENQAQTKHGGDEVVYVCVSDHGEDRCNIHMQLYRTYIPQNLRVGSTFSRVKFFDYLKSKWNFTYIFATRTDINPYIHFIHMRGIWDIEERVTIPFRCMHLRKQSIVSEQNTPKQAMNAQLVIWVCFEREKSSFSGINSISNIQRTILLRLINNSRSSRKYSLPSICHAIVLCYWMVR